MLAVDPAGYLLCGSGAAELRRAPPLAAHGPRAASCSRRRAPACSRPATCARARPSASRARSATARWSCASPTRCSPADLGAGERRASSRSSCLDALRDRTAKGSLERDFHAFCKDGWRWLSSRSRMAAVLGRRPQPRRALRRRAGGPPMPGRSRRRVTMVVLALAVAGAVMPSASRAAIIGFDDLDAGATVTDQYQDQGVSFSSNSPLVTSVAAGVASSGSNVAALPLTCNADGCFQDVTATFSQLHHLGERERRHARRRYHRPALARRLRPRRRAGRQHERLGAPGPRHGHARAERVARKAGHLDRRHQRVGEVRRLPGVRQRVPAGDGRCDLVRTPSCPERRVRLRRPRLRLAEPAGRDPGPGHGHRPADRVPRSMRSAFREARASRSRRHRALVRCSPVGAAPAAAPARPARSP